MSVLIVTSMGELVFDLFVDQCPKACENFLKLCTIKYYNQCLFYNVQPNYLLQSGDPTGTGKSGNSIEGIIHREKLRVFPDEYHPNVSLKSKLGFLGYSHLGDQPNTNQSQFFITLRTDDMEHLKKQYTIFGELAEGLDVLLAMNELYLDEDGRPYQDVRILHTYVLDDPFPNPDGLTLPDASPTYEYPPEEKVKPRIPWEPARDSDDPNNTTTTTDGRTEDEILESIRRKEAKSRAIVLEMTGDLPDAEVKPPAEVLFVCKLNPVTRDEDLELIFSRFGKIKSCEIIRDHKTGDSLNFAFIEFESEESCIAAYEAMNNVLIDDRRIKVDFSQSVSKLWNRFLMKPKKTVPVPAVKQDPEVKREVVENNYPIKRERDGNHHSGKSIRSEREPARKRSEDRKREKRNVEDHYRKDERNRTRSRSRDRDNHNRRHREEERSHHNHHREEDQSKHSSRNRSRSRERRRSTDRNYENDRRDKKRDDRKSSGEEGRRHDRDRSEDRSSKRHRDRSRSR